MAPSSGCWSPGRDASGAWGRFGNASIVSLLAVLGVGSSAMVTSLRSIRRGGTVSPNAGLPGWSTTVGPPSVWVRGSFGARAEGGVFFGVLAMTPPTSSCRGGSCGSTCCRS
ncbi:hypothetical protein NKG05_30090 [Oerskovia sp. M15]